MIQYVAMRDYLVDGARLVGSPGAGLAFKGCPMHFLLMCEWIGAHLLKIPWGALGASFDAEASGGLHGDG